MKFTIYTRYPSLNTYTNTNRHNRFAGNKLKQDCQQEAFTAILRAKLKPVSIYPISLRITYYEPNKRRDVDNITYATKFIADALVQAKIIANDSQQYLIGVDSKVMVDKENPRIEVEIIEYI